MVRESSWTEYGAISKNFSYQKLSDLCVEKCGVQTGPFGSQLHKKDYVKIGTPIITVEHLGENRIIHDNTPFVSDEDKQRLSKYLLCEGDIVFSRVGSVDRRALVRTQENDWLFSGRCLRVRANTCIVDSRYLSYFFGHEGFKNHIRRIAVGATMPSINTKILSEINVYYPPLPEQKAIAHVLGSLDDRIELNRRMNETLEGMAQALFKSWFVDFDPVLDNAIASGKEIPPELKEKATARSALGDKRHPLPKEIRTLFPNEFTYSDELGWIPKGWEVKTMDMILKSVSKTYPLKNVDKVVFLNTGDIQDGQFLHNNFSETTTLPGQAKKSIHKDDILYSEIRPKNRRFAYVSFDAPEYVVSTKLMVLRSISDIKSIFAYFILKQKSSIDYLQMMAESRSGTFPQITFDVLSTINIALPDIHSIINYFTENIIERSFNKSIANTNNSNSLTKLRDTLLPKLLSGEIRIPDAEKMVEGIKG